MTHTKLCQQCNKVIVKPYTESMKNWNNRHKFCSKKCMGDSMLGTGVTNAVKFQKGRVSNNLVHGLTKSRFHNIWCGMRKRCSNPECHSYKWYGGKGIKVESRWESFLNFKDDMYDSYIEHVTKYGDKQTTIDRKDSSQDYSRDNCVWATLAEQGLSRRRMASIVLSEELK